jgi:hypothetical protein
MVFVCLTLLHSFGCNAFQFHMSTSDWTLIQSWSDVRLYCEAGSRTAPRIIELHLEEFVRVRSLLNCICDHCLCKTFFPMAPLVLTFAMICAFLGKFAQTPFNGAFPSEVSFVIFLIHFMQFVRCACPPGNTWTGGKSPIKSDATGCYLLIDCTFTNIAQTTVAVTPGSKVDLYSSGCIFTDCCNENGAGGCFSFSRNVKSTIIRTCVTRCGATTHGGFIFLPTAQSEQTDVKEISTFQSYPNSNGKQIGGNWFSYYTSRLCITNVNITDYNPVSISKKGTILWNTNAYAPGTGVSYPPLWTTYFMVVQCTSDNLFAFATFNKAAHSWSYCAVVNCTAKTAIFDLWQTPLFCRNCFFQFTGNLMHVSSGSSYLYLWNCQFITTEKTTDRKSTRLNSSHS